VELLQAARPRATARSLASTGTVDACAYQKANLPADQLISPVVRTPGTPSIRYASWQMLMSSRTSS